MESARRLWLTGLLAAVAAAAVAAAPAKAAVNPSPTTGVPAVTVTLPPNGASLPGPSVRLQFSVSGLQIVDPGPHPHDVVGQGHLQLSVNHTAAVNVYADSYVLSSLSPGSYSVSVILVSNSGQPLVPQSSGWVNFTVVARTGWAQWVSLVLGSLVLVVAGAMMLRQWRGTTP